MRNTIAWYRKEGGAKLALDVAEAFELAANAAAEKPMSHSAYGPVPPVRRVLIRRFPYVVFFVIEEDLVVIIDTIHTSKKPPEAF
jgi:plasmid stabilization system protein ParE